MVRFDAFSEEIYGCESYVILPDWEESIRKTAGRELHYQEYLGERISVNLNKYKDFCAFALSQIY